MVVDALVGSDAVRALDALVPRWIAADWPFRQPRYLGRDITWQDWLACPRPPGPSRFAASAGPGWP